MYVELVVCAKFVCFIRQAQAFEEKIIDFLWRVGATNHPYCEMLLDLDECTTMRHNCPHTCINTPGSFECGCQEGFKKGPRGHCQGN